MAMATSPAAIRFSTGASPARDRVEAWRELYGHKVLRLDVEPLPDRPFFADVTLRVLPGLRVASGIICGTRDRRTRALMADGNDDLGLAINASGTSSVSQCGREVALSDGDATLLSCAETGTFTRPGITGYIGLRVARSALAPLVPNVDDAITRKISNNSQSLRLLTGYIRVLGDSRELQTAERQHSAVAHIHDLIALTIGASREAAAVARGRGVSAAYLRAIKLDIAANIANPDLSIATVSRRHQMTPRYIQILFRNAGTTYRDFVCGQRLNYIHRALTAPKSGGHNISDIALANGFGDISHFNKCFRRLYGASPSEVRSEAQRAYED